MASISVGAWAALVGFTGLSNRSSRGPPWGSHGFEPWAPRRSARCIQTASQNVCASSPAGIVTDAGGVVSSVSPVSPTLTATVRAETVGPVRLTVKRAGSPSPTVGETAAIVTAA